MQKEARNSQNQIIGQYFFDGNGKRVKKISNTETTIFVYDAGGQLIAEYSNQISQTPQVSYLTSDTLGSPRVLTNASGAVTSRHDYMAYGEEISRQNYGTDTIRQKYTGYQKDTETDLDFAQARMYVSKLGRFSTSDPLMASANVINPQTFNRYSYVLNSPYNLIDPSGLAPEGKSGGRPAPMEDWGFGIWGNADAEARYEKDLAITREEMAKAQEKAKEDAQSGNVVALHEDLHEAATEEVTSQDENNTSESAESNENGEKPPKIKVITKINRNRTYNVAGADANTAIQNASIQCNNRQAQGCTNYRYPWRSTRSSRSNQVSTATVTLTVTITVTLPKWTGYKRASEAEKRIWDNFITRLRSHEEGHVQIAVAGAREVANAIPGRASTSKELGVIETANFNRAFATVVARQEAYDIRTNHGLNQ